MSEQLWFTWNTWGFSGNYGFQFCAASRGLLEANGLLNIHAERFQAIQKYVNYELPPGTVNPAQVTADIAPLGLALIWTGFEYILMQRAYVERDGMNRVGSFFAHILTNLPPAQAGLTGQLHFSAREAIELWRSPFWRRSMSGQPQGETLVEQVSVAQLERLPLVRDAAMLREAGVSREELYFVIQAFLSLKEGQHIYLIASSSAQIAALIWGLTHAFPRTLRQMQTFSFSTYEHTALDPSTVGSLNGPFPPTLIGTSWLSTPTDLPDICYKQHIALNCQTKRSTPLAPQSSLDAFVQFVVDCFFEENEHTLSELSNMVLEAEGENFTEIPDFIRLYTIRRERLKRDDIAQGLALLNQELPRFLRGEQFPSRGIKQVGSPNFHHWASYWMFHDPTWWEQQGRGEVERLRDFAGKDLRTISGVQFNPAALALLESTQNAVNVFLEKLSTPAMDQIPPAILRNRSQEVTFWCNVCSATVSSQREPSYWARMFNALYTAGTTTSPFNQAYQDWWTGFARKRMEDAIRQYVQMYPKDPLTQELSTYVRYVNRQFRVALLEREKEGEALFWGEVVSISSSPESEPHVWSEIFSGWSAPDASKNGWSAPDIFKTQAYWKWWKNYGRARIPEAERLIAGRPEPELNVALLSLGKMLTDFVWQSLIVEKADPQVFQRWSEDFTLLASPGRFSDLAFRLWNGLLSYRYTPNYLLWWQQQGQRVLQNMLVLSRQNGSDFRQFLQMLDKVADKLAESASANTQQELPFWIDVLGQGAPLPESPFPWLHLWGNLVRTPYTPSYELWWKQQGYTTLQSIGQLARQDPRVVGEEFLRLLGQIASRLAESLSSNQREEMGFWNTALAQGAPPTERLEIWVQVWQSLANHPDLSYAPAYNDWWTRQGQLTLQCLLKFMQESGGASLAGPFADIFARAGDKLIESANSHDQDGTWFWNTALVTGAPFTYTQLPWFHLWEKLARTPYTPVLGLWWSKYHQTIVRQIADAYPRDAATPLDGLRKAAQAQISTLIGVYNQAATPQEATVSDTFKRCEEAISFWTDVAATARPLEIVPRQWIKLHRELWQLMSTPGYTYWWRQHGRAILEKIRAQAAQKAQRATQQLDATTRELLEFAREVGAALAQLLLEYARRMNREQMSVAPFPSLSLIIDVYTCALPTGMAPAEWVNVLHTVNEGLTASIEDIYPLNLRKLLFEAWSGLLELPAEARPWVTLRWDELDAPRELALSDAWTDIIFRQLLTRPWKNDGLSDELARVKIAAHFDAICKALQTYMREPQSWKVVRAYVTLLNGMPGYYRRLLSKLLEVAPPASEGEGFLYEQASALVPQELAELLEDPQLVFMQQPTLAPSLWRLVGKYLQDFAYPWLARPSTYIFLKNLSGRADLPYEQRTTVDGLMEFSAFIKHPTFDSPRLIQISDRLRTMSTLNDAMRRALLDQLVPSLSAHLSSVMDIGLVTYLLALPDPQQKQEDLLLLQKLITEAASRGYTQESPPIKVASYIAVILGKTRLLPPQEAYKESRRLLDILLQNVSEDALQKIDAHVLLWGEGERWQLYRIFRAWREYKLDLRKPEPIEKAAAAFQAASALSTDYKITTENISQDEYQLGQALVELLEACQQQDRRRIVRVDAQLQRYPAVPAQMYSLMVRQQVEQARQYLRAQQQDEMAHVLDTSITRTQYLHLRRLQVLLTGYIAEQSKTLKQSRKAKSGDLLHISQELVELENLKRAMPGMLRKRPLPSATLSCLIDDVLIQEWMQEVPPQEVAPPELAERDCSGLGKQVQSYLERTKQPLLKEKDAELSVIIWGLEILYRRSAFFLLFKKKWSKQFLTQKKEQYLEKGQLKANDDALSLGEIIKVLREKSSATDATTVR